MTDKHPFVSVCIANYNGMDIIDACITSVMAQDCNFPVEIIIHDDASTDGSRGPYPRTLSRNHSDRKYGKCRLLHRKQPHGGLSHRVNSCCYSTTMPNFIPDALSTLHIEAMQIGHSAILGLPQYDAATGELIDIGCLLDPFLNPVPNLDPNRNEVGMVIGACIWLPKHLWHELGGFPEWFGSIAEDMYLCCRARLAGYPVRALSKSGYRHWQGKSFGGNKITDNRLSTTFRRRALSERNKSFTMIVCLPTYLLLLTLPIHLFAMAAEGILLSLAKRDLRIWRDIYGACFSSLWSKKEHLALIRASVQATRRITYTQWLAVFTAIPHKLRLLLRHGLPNVKV